MQFRGLFTDDPELSDAVERMAKASDEDRGAVAETFRQAVEREQTWEHEFRLCLPGHAEPRWFLGRARPVRAGAGRSSSSSQANAALNGPRNRVNCRC